MKTAILIEHGTVTSNKIHINSNEFTIGRGLNNSHVVQDLNVSRKHLLIEFRHGRWYIYDLSANGTWLNESRLDNNIGKGLGHGDVIKLSDSCKYVFNIIPNEELVVPLSEEEIVNVAEEVFASADAFNVEFAEESVPTVVPGTSNDNSAASTSALDKFEFAEDELQCSICTEMFIKAVTLECAHTFCTYCISQWKKTKSDCPICRRKITASCPTIVVDNYIDRIIETASDEFKKRRQEVKAQREAALVDTYSPVTHYKHYTLTHPAAAPIDMPSSGDEEDDYDEDDDDMSYSSDSEYESRSRRPYYGGYGRCYSCGQRGHWANGCPSRGIR